jgi:hypothetical protein
VLVLALLIITLSAHLSAQELELDTMRPSPGELILRVAGAPTERIASSLKDGMRADLEVVIRLFERTDGIAGLLGDRLIAEHHVTKTAYYDPFSRAYVVETSGTARSADDPRRLPVERGVDAAVGELLTVTGVSGPDAPDPGVDDEDHYVVARVLLRPLKLVERLRIISFLLPSYTVRSAWTRLPALGVAGESLRGSGDRR